MEPERGPASTLQNMGCPGRDRGFEHARGDKTRERALPEEAVFVPARPIHRSKAIGLCEYRSKRGAARRSAGRNRKSQPGGCHVLHGAHVGAVPRAFLRPLREVEVGRIVWALLRPGLPPFLALSVHAAVEAQVEMAAALGVLLLFSRRLKITGTWEGSM
jgi:hypothetical protein